MTFRVFFVIVCAGLGLGISSCADREALPTEAGDVQIGVHSLPLSLDPYERNEVLSFAVLFNVYDRLTHFESGSRVGPGLAIGWETPSDTTWLFRLREGVMFHDGSKLTSEDVVASLKRAREPASEMSSFLAEVASIRAVGEHTIEIVTHRPTPVLPAKLSFIGILPSEAPTEIVHPVGSGPYRFDGIEGGRVLRMTRFRASWHGPGGPSDASFVAIAELEERFRALQEGQVDLIHEVPPDLYERGLETPGIRGSLTPSRHVEYLHLHPRLPPFDDLQVRRAVDLALDREQIVEKVLLGHGIAATQMISPETFGFDPTLRSPERDLEEARRLLAKAGYPEGIEVDLLYRASRRGEVIRDQLAEAGIRVKLRAASWEEVYDELIEQRVPFYYAGVVSTTGDGSDVLDVFAHSREGPEGRGRGNQIQYSNPELDAMIEAASGELRPKARRGLLQECFARLRDDAVYLPLVVPDEHYLMNEELLWTPDTEGLLQLIEMSWQPAH